MNAPGKALTPVQLGNSCRIQPPGGTEFPTLLTERQRLLSTHQLPTHSLQWGPAHSLFKVKYMLSVGASDQQRMFWFLRGCSQLNEIQPLACLSPKTSQGDRQAGVGCVQHAEAGLCVLGLQVSGLGFKAQMEAQWMDRAPRPRLSSHGASRDLLASPLPAASTGSFSKYASLFSHLEFSNVLPCSA